MDALYTANRFAAFSGGRRKQTSENGAQQVEKCRVLTGREDFFVR